MQIRHRTRSGLLTGLALGVGLTTACGPPADSETPAPGAAVAPTVPASAIARFFPLASGHIYHYVTETDGGEGMMITRVSRADGSSGDLQGPQGTKTFHYAADGVTLDAGGALPVYVLKVPFTVGNKWRGQGGSSVEIVEVDASVIVPAGTYSGCIKTLEQRGGDRPLRIATTYCPDTGIVLLEAASGTVMERVALKSYGPPVDLGPDGIRQLPPEGPPPDDAPPDGAPPP